MHLYAARPPDPYTARASPASAMKLAVTLILVTLAVYCNSESVQICPGFLHVIETLLMGTLSSYETALQPFNPDQNLTNAGIQMKQLLDTLPQVTRVNVMKLTEKILKSPLCA
ncbi:uteroglobin [Castor canadensis]|uniref:Uteroglobin n=2 Tax=Castor canadensis TaxID=51338 RepID=A0A8C0X7H8_CASCN